MATQDTDSKLCPACQRKVLAPQHRRCMYCGVQLPKDLVLSEAESISVLREKHEKWRAETAALEARKPKDKDKKRRKRGESEPEESESAILLNAMAEQHAARREPALDQTPAQDQGKESGGGVKKVVAEPVQAAEEKLPVEPAETDAEKLRAARLLVAKADAAEAAAAKAAAVKAAAAKTAAAKTAAAKTTTSRTATAKPVTAKTTVAKSEADKAEAAKIAAAKLKVARLKAKLKRDG